MAPARASIENPVTGERFSIVQSAQETNGAVLQMDFFMRPYGFVAAEHIHPYQEERFKILAGTLHFHVAGRTQVLEAGQALVVPAGTPHKWWNAGAIEGHVLIEFRPAMQTQFFFETLFGLARDGKTDQHGRPNLFQIAVLAPAYRNEMQPAAWLDKLLFKMLLPVLAPLGRRLGYKARYPQYSENGVDGP